MKLISIPATETTPATINLLTENGNKFASIDKQGKLIVMGEDMYLDAPERKQIDVISDNFDLFYYNIKTL